MPAAIGLRARREAINAELPEAPFQRWAAIFFSFFVLTLVLSLSASQAFLAASGVCYAIHLIKTPPALTFPPAIKLPLAIFCIGTVLSVLWAANPSAGLFVVRKLVLFLIVLFTANLIVSRKHLIFLLKGLFVESAVAALVSAVQFLSRYNEARTLHPNEVYAFMTSDRTTGFMGHWMNFSGQQMLVFAALSAFLLIGQQARRSESRPNKQNHWEQRHTVLWWALLVVIAISIVLGFTRGVWLGCFAASIYLLTRWQPRVLLAIPVLLAVTYFAAPSLVQQRLRYMLHPRSEPALSIRLEMWDVAVRMMRSHPWLGVGPNNIERQYVLYLPPGRVPEIGYHAHFHSNFFQFGAERGLPVLAAWVWLMVALLLSVWRLRRSLDSLRWVADAAIAAWLAFVIEGFFEFNFGTSPVLMLFLFVMSAPFAAERIRSSANPGEYLAEANRPSFEA